MPNRLSDSPLDGQDQKVFLKIFCLQSGIQKCFRKFGERVNECYKITKFVMEQKFDPLPRAVKSTVYIQASTHILRFQLQPNLKHYVHLTRHFHT